MELSIPVSVGELFDRVTILRIKALRLTDRSKLRHVRGELERLEAVLSENVEPDEDGRRDMEELADINGRLWDVEDRLRALEAAGDFGAEFVAAARSVYALNDDRHRVKRRVSVRYGSGVVEEKSYA